MVTSLRWELESWIVLQYSVRILCVPLRRVVVSEVIPLFTCGLSSMSLYRLRIEQSIARQVAKVFAVVRDFFGFRSKDAKAESWFVNQRRPRRVLRYHWKYGSHGGKSGTHVLDMCNFMTLTSYCTNLWSAKLGENKNTRVMCLRRHFWNTYLVAWCYLDNL